MAKASNQSRHTKQNRWQLIPLGLAVLVVFVFFDSPCLGQRVQIPTQTFASPAPQWGATTTPTYTPNVPPPTFNPYGTPASAAGVPAATYPPVTPGYTTQPITPYTGQPIVPSAGSVPTLSTSPYGTPVAPGPSYSYAAPPASNGFGSAGNSIGWQPGTYGFQDANGDTTTFRRLVARLRGEHTLLLGDNSADAFEVNRLEIASTLAFPFAGNIDAPLLVTPGFAFNWLGGPEGDPAGMPRGPDLPPRVYDAYLDFAWYPKFNPSLGAELGFRTGVWTDFDEVNDDSLRLLGRAIGVITVTPEFELLLGVVYLDRLRVKMLPAGGVRWRPSPEWDLYLVFPNPKIRRTLSSAGGADWWWFVGGEYGGGSWTVERAGLGDRIDYNDIRISMGLEWQTISQLRGHIEIGYAFDREVLFASGDPGNFKPDDAVMFRFGIGY